jgi:hypothetical protein
MARSSAVGDWEAKMASEPEQARILDNISRDACIPPEVFQEFFARVEVFAHADPPQTADQAQDIGWEVVHQDPDRFTCQGRPVPDGVFVSLVRFEDIGSLQYRVPDVLREKGLRDPEALPALPDEDLRTVTDEHDGDVQLGNLLALVWVSDFDFVQGQGYDCEGHDGLGELIDRLGLDHLDGASRCVICVFDRDRADGSLHVPRSLDAISMPAFELVEDCSAEQGQTRPLHSPDKGGLPEAVLRSCTVRPTTWALRSLR